MDAINDKLAKVRYPDDFSRKARKLEFGDTKASRATLGRPMIIFILFQAEEIRNYYLVSHNIIGSCLRLGKFKKKMHLEKRVFFYYVYLLRALLLPEDEYNAFFTDDDIIKLRRQLYRDYQVNVQRKFKIHLLKKSFFFRRSSVNRQ